MKVLELAQLCLALNVYHEARGEPLDGQLAVAHVTINRAHHQPALVCGEVFKYKQFSWTNASRDVEDEKAWNLARRVAKQALKEAKQKSDPVEGATFYHARRVHPKWAKAYDQVAQVGNHIFFRYRK